MEDCSKAFRVQFFDCFKILWEAQLYKKYTSCCDFAFYTKQWRRLNLLYCFHASVFAHFILRSFCLFALRFKCCQLIRNSVFFHVFFTSSSANVVCCWGRVEHWCRAFMVQSCWHKMAADWNVLHLPHTVSTSTHTHCFSVLGFWYLLLQTLQSFCRPLGNMWTTLMLIAWAS